MPGDPLRDYKRGELLDAATVNAHSRFQKRIAKAFNSPGSGDSLFPKSNTIVLMRNDGASGEDVDRFGVLGIDGVVITRDDNEIEFESVILLSGVLPLESSSSVDGHEGKFAIALEPIAIGDIGRVVIAGAVQCQIDVTDEDHQFADVLDGDNTMLASGDSGARILWKASGTGTKWAVINIAGFGGASVGTTTPKKTLASTGLTANTDTWNRDTDAEAVEFIAYRVAWDGTAKILYEFCRTPLYDSIGSLYSVSAEVKTAIDTTVACA